MSALASRFAVNGDCRCYAGEAIVIELALDDGAGGTVDLAGRSFAFTIYRTTDRVQLASVQGETLTDDDGHFVRFSIGGATTEGLWVGRLNLAHEVAELNDAGREVWLAGKLALDRSPASVIPSPGANAAPATRYVFDRRQRRAIITAKGAPGVGGDTAYQIAISDGFNGTKEQWLASLRSPVRRTGFGRGVVSARWNSLNRFNDDPSCVALTTDPTETAEALFPIPVDCFNLVVVTPNILYTSQSAETQQATPVSISQTIKINGVSTPLTCGGATQWQIQPGDQRGTDPLGFDVPAGSTVSVVTTVYQSGTSTWPRNLAVRTGDVPANAKPLMFGPAAIFGDTPPGIVSPAVGIVGDSEANGGADPAGGGYVARGLGSTGALVATAVPVLNAALGGTTAAQFAGSVGSVAVNSVRRRKQVFGLPFLFLLFGTNDRAAGRSVAQWQADMLAIALDAARRGSRTIVGTLPPRTTGDWTHANTQVVVPGNEAWRLPANAWLRGGAPILDGAAVAIGTASALLAGQSGHPFWRVMDGAALIECNAAGVVTVDGGFWLPGTTSDGTHPNSVGAPIMAAAVPLAEILAAPDIVPVTASNAAIAALGAQVGGRASKIANLADLADPAQARLNIAAQPYSADLVALAALLAGGNKEGLRALVRSGAMRGISATLTGVDMTAGYSVSWDRAIYDDGGWWDPAAPTSFKVPAGVTRVRIYFSAQIMAITAGNTLQMTVTKNGLLDYDGMVAHADTLSLSGRYICVASAPIPVAAGDVFVPALFVSGDNSVNVVGARTVFSIEAA